MDKQEYEQMKQKCWKKFCRHIVDEEEEFYNMFDRAYSLGKQEKDADTVTINKTLDDEPIEVEIIIKRKKKWKYWKAQIPVEA